MSILDKVKEAALNQFIEVIEWLDESKDTLLYRFPVYQQEIKNGAQLIVRESQAAVFVFEGQVADVFTPGRYTVEGGNTPILSKLGAWKHGFNSPIKSEVYFVNTKQFTDMKWGTSNPIMLRDADFGIVRLRAFGAYSLRVADPGEFIKQVAGTNAHFQTEDIDGQLKRAIVTEFSDAIGEMKIPALDLAAQYKEMGEAIRAKINEDFSGYGLEVTKFYVENISVHRWELSAMLRSICSSRLRTPCVTRPRMKAAVRGLARVSAPALRSADRWRMPLEPDRRAVAVRQLRLHARAAENRTTRPQSSARTAAARWKSLRCHA